jgi:hypothetical protein
VSLTEESPKHDPVQFWLNLLSIAISFSFSIGTGYWIYNLTMAQMRKMEGEGGEMEGEMAAEAFEHGGLLDEYEDEEVEEHLTGVGRGGGGGGGGRPGGVVRRVSSGSDVV